MSDARGESVSRESQRQLTPLSDTALASAQTAATAFVVLERTAPKTETRIRWSVEATAAAVGERGRRAIEPRRPRSTGTGRPARFRFVHSYRTPAKLLAVEAANRFGRFGVGCELHERKAARASGLAIRDDSRSNNRADGLERFEQFLVCETETQIADKN